MTARISASDLAKQLGIDAKSLRVYLRANAVPRDDGTSRYLFTPAQVKEHPKVSGPGLVETVISPGK